MAKPLVSVLIPIYNVEKFVERCARSIFEQTYDNLEITFVNDCSPDNSVEIIEKVLAEYPNRLPQTRIVNHEKNQGLAAARLTGLRAATGKYVQNIDSDDWIDVNMISEMVALAETEDADITICDFMYVYRDPQMQKHVNPPLEPKACLEAVLLGKVHSSVANKLIRRDLYLANNIHPIPGLDYLEDLSVMYRLLYFSKKLSYIPKPYYYYNQLNESSYTTCGYSTANQKNMMQLIALCQSFQKTYPISEMLSKSFRYNLAGTYSRIAFQGNLKLLKSNIRLFASLKEADIASHPNLPKNVRRAGLLIYRKKIITLHILRFLKTIKNYERKIFNLSDLKCLS